MATEKRLIDANALMKAIKSFRWFGVPNTLQLMFDYLKIIIRDQPTVDTVELPCKIGDRVYAIRSYKGHKRPQDGIVSDMLFTQDMRLQIVVKHIARGEWGKQIFATREEAVSAIEGERN